MLRSLWTMMAAVLLLALSSCTFQSDTVLMSRAINSDEVEGLSAVRTSLLSGRDPKSGKWQVFADIIPHRDADGLSYLMQEPGDQPDETRKKAQAGTDYSALFFRKLGPGRYVLRYVTVKGGKTGQTGIGFVTAENGRFFVLTRIGDEKLRARTMAAGSTLAGVANDILAGGDGTKSNNLMVSSWQQAEGISRTFHEQRQLFEANDYAELRVD